MSYETDQKKFIAHCKWALADFEFELAEAKEAREQAMRECKDPIKRENAGSRAGNLVMLNALKSCGREKWRVRNDKNTKRQ